MLVHSLFNRFGYTILQVSYKTLNADVTDDMMAAF